MTVPSQSDLQKYARYVTDMVAPFDPTPVITDISRKEDGTTVLTTSDGRVCLVGDETLAAMRGHKWTEPSVVVFIAGCFDGFHVGHLSILERARALGDHLIVGLNDDAHLAAKGPGRPIDSWDDRAHNVGETGCVSVIHRIGDSPLDLILSIKPDIICVGDDYDLESTVGYPQCLSWGGKVVVLPRTAGISTTDIVNQSHESSS